MCARNIVIIVVHAVLTHCCPYHTIYTFAADMRDSIVDIKRPNSVTRRDYYIGQLAEQFPREIGKMNDCTYIENALMIVCSMGWAGFICDSDYIYMMPSNTIR